MLWKHRTVSSAGLRLKAVELPTIFRKDTDVGGPPSSKRFSKTIVKRGPRPKNEVTYITDLAEVQQNEVNEP